MNRIDEEREPPSGSEHKISTVRKDEENVENSSNVRSEDATNLRKRNPHGHSERQSNPSVDSFRTPLSSNRSSTRLGTPSSRRSGRTGTPRTFASLRAAFSPPKQFVSFMSPRNHHRGQSARRKLNSENGGIYDPKKTIFSPESCIGLLQYHGPTRLHDACYKSKDPKYLCQIIDSFSKSREGRRQNNLSLEFSAAACTKDDEGRLPLHLLSENKFLSDALLRRDEKSDSNRLSLEAEFKYLIDKVLCPLLEANPTAVLEKDGNGYLPVERSIVEWINDSHDSHETDLRFCLLKEISANSLGTQLEHSFQQVVNTSISVSKAALGPLAKAGRSLQKSGGLTGPQSSMHNSYNDHVSHSRGRMSSLDETAIFKGVDDLEEGDLSQLAGICETLGQDASDAIDSKWMRGKSKIAFTRESTFPANVCVTPHMEFSLRFLSAICEKLEADAIEEEKILSIEFSPNPPKAEEVIDKAGPSCETSSADTQRLVVDTIAAIPDLIKTMLLVPDEGERNRIISYCISRKSMLSKMAVGRWITFMLQSNSKELSNRAVEYLRLLSLVIEEDQKERYKTKQPSRDDVPEAVLALEDLIPSMLMLDENTMEQAATTPIIRHVLDKMITRPFAVSVVFFDSLFLACLIVSFRGSVITFLSGQKPETVMIFIYLASAMTFYFIVRELGKAISLLTITQRDFWINFFWGFWNIVDILSIIMALVSEFAIRGNLSNSAMLDGSSNGLRVILAITTGLLWLKVLGLLKTINMQLATFVLAIVQITRDILWFLLILFAAVVSFSQMFYTLLLPPYCSKSGESKEHPECDPAEYYLRMYSILLGDFGSFDREEFSTKFSVLLFVLFSFMVIIVLNVLIAIVSDSYEKCLLRSQLLFGRARLMLLAELVSFQNLLRKKECHQNETSSDGQIRSNRHWWTKHRCRGYTMGGCIFVTLSVSVLLLLLTAEMVAYATDNHYGNMKYSFLSLLFNVVILVATIVFLSQGPGGMTDSTKRADGRFQCCECWYTNSIHKIMLRLLGTSEETSYAVSDVEEWRGRINYIQNEMVRLSAESAAQTRAEIKKLEQGVSSCDSKIRAELMSLESRTMQSEERVMAAIKASERRIERLIGEMLRSKQDE